MAAEQNFANHSRLFPPFHFFVIPVLMVNLVWSLVLLWKTGLTFAGVFGVILAAALLMGFLSARVFALTVQDRVIRLEEQLRYARLLPPDLQARIGEFTISQFVSLRFASDAELPALARKVLDEKVAERKAIKQLIKNWKPDYVRA
jgi:Family of unknown function (DUF6526)